MNLTAQLGVADDILGSGERGGRTVALDHDEGLRTLASHALHTCALTAVIGCSAGEACRSEADTRWFEFHHRFLPRRHRLPCSPGTHIRVLPRTTENSTVSATTPWSSSVGCPMEAPTYRCPRRYRTDSSSPPSVAE
jgi:hypothetical protein